MRRLGRLTARYGLSLFLWLSAATAAAQELAPPDAGFARFCADYGPGWTVWSGASGVPSRVFGPGKPLGVRDLAAAREVCAQITNRHAAWLGLVPGSWREVFAHAGRSTLVVRLQQLHRGVSVHDAFVDVTFARGDGGLACLGSTAIPGLTLAVTPQLEAGAAVARALRALGWPAASAHGHGAPELQVVRRDDDGAPVLAWRCELAHGARPEAFALWIDAQSGAVARREARAHACRHAPTAPRASALLGTVRGYLTPRTGGMNPVTNPPALAPLPGVVVAALGVGEAVTDADGNFSIPYAGSTSVNLAVSLARGPRFDPLVDLSGTPIVSAGALAAPDVPVTLTLNATAAEWPTAQVNAAAYTTLMHAHARGYLPNTSVLDAPVAVTVNQGAPCNAFYLAGGIWFFRSSVDCFNTATAALIGHEYGHAIDDRLGGIGATPRTPSEGFADACAALWLEDPLIGRDVARVGSLARDARNTLRHPLTGTSQAVHDFGLPFLGLVWDVFVAARARWGDAVARQVANHALFEAALADPRDMRQALLQLYLADDDDSSLDNGTPHSAVFAPAARARNFVQPVFAALRVEHTPPLAAALWDAAAELIVDVFGKRGAVLGVNLHFDAGQGPRVVAMSSAGGNRWRAAPGAVPQRSVARYWFEIDSDLGHRERWPATSSYPLAVGARQSVFAASFESGLGGFVASSSNGAAGWQAHAPIGRNYDPADAPAGVAIVGVNRSASDERVALGSATYTLTSPGLTLAGRQGTRLRFRRWLTLDRDSTFAVYVDGNLVAQDSAVGEQEWSWHDLDISAFADRRNNVTLRFELTHRGSDPVGGPSLDDLEVYTLGSICPSPFVTGRGHRGTLGEPGLGIIGEPRAGSRLFGWSVQSTRPSSAAILVVGTQTIAQPLFGGVLRASPDIQLPFFTAAAGNTTLPLPLPDNSGLAWQPIRAQVLVFDPAATGGFAFSYGLGFELCPGY